MKLILRIIWQQAQRHPRTYATSMILVLLVAAVWVADPLYTRYAIDTMLSVKTGATVNFALIFGLWGCLFVLHALLQSLNKFTAWKLDNLMILERREDVFRRTLDLGISFHTRQKSGEVVKILDEGADVMSELQRHILIELIPSFLSAAAFLVAGFLLSPLMSGVLLLGLLLYVGIAVTGTRYTAKLQHQVNALWVQAIGRAYDAITNIHAVKSGAQETTEMGRLQRTHKQTFDRQQQVNYRWAMVEGINFFFLTRILLVAIGIYLFVHDVLSLGEVYFFQSSFYRVLAPFEILGSLLPQWNKLVGKVRLSQQILESPQDVRNIEHPKTLPELRGEIVLDKICFSYAPERELRDSDGEKDIKLIREPEPEEEERPHPIPLPEENDDLAERAAEPVPDPDKEDRHPGEVLHDITLSVKPGEHLAFVGHSGAGKSTMAMLLNRFYDVTKGSIRIDGVDLRELDYRWWRSQIGLVLQENIMFNDSILENIRYARPDATLEEVKEAARRAAAAEFIEPLPQGYNTMIGDRGVRLSGGQRQRVAIARAILKRPKIVVLDEATSALDSVTERAVQEGIRELVTGRTSFIIAHRLSTVRSVDRIAMLDKGRLIAAAPHEELMKTCPTYREMVELQSHGLLAE